jgi:hypothetical protein
MPVHAPTGGAEPLPDGYNDHNINKLQQASAIVEMDAAHTADSKFLSQTELPREPGKLHHGGREDLAPGTEPLGDPPDPWARLAHWGLA